MGWLATSLSLSLLSPLTTNAVEFLDTADHWGKAYIEQLAEEGFVKGKEEDSEGNLSFLPQDTMTQAEFLVVVIAAFPYEGELSDVSHPNFWWADFYNKGEAKGILPYHWTLETAGSVEITREEMAYVCYQVLLSEKETIGERYPEESIGDFIDIGAEFKESVQKCFAMGIVSGQDVTEEGLPLYNPQGKMTRAEACVVLGNLIWEENRNLPTEEEQEEEQESTDSEETPEGSLELDHQLGLIADALATWSAPTEYPEPSAYMVTDLDQNGRLELIATVCTGTGSTSFNQYYQVSQEGNSLELIRVVRTHSELTPDWYLEETMDVFYDDNTHTYYYDVSDLWKDGSTCTYFSNFGWWIENDTVYTAMYRQEQDRINDEGFNRTTSYWSGKNENITKEQFDALGSAYFEGMAEMQAVFHWFYFDPSFVSNPDKLLEKLQESYDNFSLIAMENDELVEGAEPSEEVTEEETEEESAQEETTEEQA